jgi:hypothetical protein
MPRSTRYLCRRRPLPSVSCAWTACQRRPSALLALKPSSLLAMPTPTPVNLDYWLGTEYAHDPTHDTSSYVISRHFPTTKPVVWKFPSLVQYPIFFVAIVLYYLLALKHYKYHIEGPFPLTIKYISLTKNMAGAGLPFSELSRAKIGTHLTPCGHGVCMI